MITQQIEFHFTISFNPNLLNRVAGLGIREPRYMTYMDTFNQCTINVIEISTMLGLKRVKKL